MHPDPARLSDLPAALREHAAALDALPGRLQAVAHQAEAAMTIILLAGLLLGWLLFRRRA